MVWADSRYTESPPDGVYSAFSFIPMDPTNHNAGYKITIKRGERDPFLISNRANPWFWTKLICTTNHHKGKLDPDKSIWFFNEIQSEMKSSQHFQKN